MKAMCKEAVIIIIGVIITIEVVNTTITEATIKDTMKVEVDISKITEVKEVVTTIDMSSTTIQSSCHCTQKKMRSLKLVNLSLRLPEVAANTEAQTEAAEAAIEEVEETTGLMMNMYKGKQTKMPFIEISSMTIKDMTTTTEEEATSSKDPTTTRDQLSSKIQLRKI